MSGGSMNYIYSQLQEAADMTSDKEIKDLLMDLSEVLHDEEWYKSYDYSFEIYQETLLKFKCKWFDQPRRDRLKKYIDESIEKSRKEMYMLVGIGVSDDE